MRYLKRWGSVHCSDLLVAVRSWVDPVPQLHSDFDALSSAVAGSRLTIPCKVFLGAGIPTTTVLWWMANNTHIDDAYQGGRVTEGQRQ